MLIGAPGLIKEDIHIVIGKEEILRGTIQVMCLLCETIEPVHRAVASPMPIEQRTDGICHIEECHAFGFLVVGRPVVDGIDTHAIYFDIGPSLCDDLTADCGAVVIVVGNLQIFFLAAVARLFVIELIVLIP